MKYFIECPECGVAYVIERESVPVTCSKCGYASPKITLENTKARQRAREAMLRMDEMKPQLLEARRAYMELMAKYEAECQIVRAYARRGIVTPEEKDRYMIGKSESLKRTTLTECMKEHWRREKKRNEPS